MLVVCHGHPDEEPGGGENYAYALFRALKQTGVEPSFLFPGEPSGDAAVAPYGDRPGEYVFPYVAEGGLATGYTLFDDSRHFTDAFAGELSAFLRSLAPDVVHFHHYYRVGLELLALTRNVLPEALICLTLHDLKAICPANGYMVRTHERTVDGRMRALCLDSSVDRCAQCCDDRSTDELTRRRLAAIAGFEHVDLFLAPSRWLLERYAAWGVDRGRLRHLDYGLTSARIDPLPPPTNGCDRFGFFGRYTDYKGLDVLLDAIRILRHGSCPASVVLNTPEVTENAAAARALDQLADGSAPMVEVRGAYRPDELGARLADVDWVVVPSIWWENSPLVIKEAFAHGRPVLCSDVGGMAENVRHGEDGLHFRVGDPADLARTIRMTVGNRPLWDLLRARRPALEEITANSTRTLALYEEGRAARSTRAASAAASSSDRPPAAAASVATSYSTVTNPS